jgi:pentapeptide MXKDX repeat protein
VTIAARGSLILPTADRYFISFEEDALLKGTRRLQRVVVIAAVAIAFGLGGVVDQSIAQDNMKKDDKMKSSDKMSGDKMKSGDTMMKDDKKGDMKAGEVRKDDKMMPGDKTMEKK